MFLIFIAFFFTHKQINHLVEFQKIVFILENKEKRDKKILIARIN